MHLEDRENRVDRWDPFHLLDRPIQAVRHYRVVLMIRYFRWLLMNQKVLVDQLSQEHPCCQLLLMIRESRLDLAVQLHQDYLLMHFREVLLDQ